MRLGSKSATARELQIHNSTVHDALKWCEHKGHAPWLTPALTPEHLDLVKTTVQYDEAGKPVREWKRLVPGAADMEAFVDALCARVQGKAKIRKLPPKKTQNADLLGEISIFDSHIGMYADRRETNDQDYDCGIAGKRMVDTAEALAARFSKPGRMVVTFGGDIMHSDNRRNQTEKSGNPLDVDTRFSRVVDYAVRACYDVVQIAAQLAPQVDIVVVEGNHDWHSCVWLSRVLSSFYTNCPHINVVTQASSRKHLVFGSNLLCWTHGDGAAMNLWQQIIAAEFPKQWGATKFRHLKMGHIHHKKKNQPMRVITQSKRGWEEQRGLLVEYLPALCSTDAWHAEKGFIGNIKGASGFEYHKNAGLITRFYQHI